MFRTTYNSSRKAELDAKKTDFINAVIAGDAATVESFIKDRDIILNWDFMTKTTVVVTSSTYCSYTHALIIAACLNHTGVIEALAKSPRFDINVKNAWEETALNAAAQNGHSDTVKLLLTHPKIDVNNRSKTYNSLHASIRNGHTDVMHALLAHPNIDLTSKDCFGRTPAEMVDFYRVKVDAQFAARLSLPAVQPKHSPGFLHQTSSSSSTEPQQSTSSSSFNL